MRKKSYRTIAMGGTFDKFHNGHKHFIDFAAQLANKLHIGITSQKLTFKKKYSNIIDPFDTRRRAVMSYCQSKNIDCSTSKLTDVYGPTVLENKIDALCVTEETISGAQKINQAREAMNFKDLPVHVCTWLKDEDNEILSSTRIRAGKVNIAGQVYDKILRQDLKLTQAQREFFGKAQGELITNYDLLKINKKNNIYAVGDTSLDLFLERKLNYDLGVYDKKSQRQTHISEQIDKINSDLNCQNPAGNITLQLTKALKQSLKNNLKHLFVNGEEDAATLALVLLVPLGSHIFYGQPNEGIVDILVTEKVKERFFFKLSSQE